MDASVPVYPNAQQANNHLNGLQQQQNNQIVPLHQQQQQQLVGNRILPHNEAPIEINPKRQAVVDRLKRRIETYRRRQSDCSPRFDQAFSGVCEQQSLETNALQKKFLENKPKRPVKKTEKKSAENTLTSNLQSSVHVVSPVFSLFSPNQTPKHVFS
jgi:hypothetical protein